MLESIVSLFGRPDARAWYSRAVGRSFSLGIVSLVVLNAIVYGAIAWNLEGWRSWAVAILWLIASFFLSGRLAGLFMSLAAGAWVDELGLMSVITGDKIVRLERARFGDLGREWGSALLSGLVSLAVAPLFFFPLLIPLAVLPLAWALGRESVALGLRINRQNLSGPRGGLETRSALFYAGLGFVPALLSLFPVLAWIALPFLQLAGARVVLNEAPIAKQAMSESPIRHEDFR